MVGKSVKQVGGIPELVGRRGTVKEEFTDEKDNMHAYVASDEGDDFWCPVSLLEVV